MLGTFTKKSILNSRFFHFMKINLPVSTVYIGLDIQKKKVNFSQILHCIFIVKKEFKIKIHLSCPCTAKKYLVIHTLFCNFKKSRKIKPKFHTTYLRGFVIILGQNTP